MLLQSIATRKSWLEAVSLKDYKTMENKNERNENKIILREFNCTMKKEGTGMVEIK